MFSIVPVLNAFLVLRARRVKDPIYCRLIIPDRKEVGWLWRDASRSERLLETGESFVLSLRESPDVKITWRPMFNAEISGDERARQYAMWFLEQNPMVSGGTHLTLDEFTFGEAPWDREASDFHLVRCGKYSTRTGRHWRHPSENARRWVESKLFKVNANIRSHVRESLSQPLPSGEWVTIRRIFPEEEFDTKTE